MYYVLIKTDMTDRDYLKYLHIFRPIVILKDLWILPNLIIFKIDYNF